MMSALEVILHPTDFSEEANQAFQIACNVAREQRARLVILHVIPLSVSDADLDSLDEDRPAVSYCREQFERLRTLADNIALKFRIVLGYPVGMILNVARQEAANLIVIASCQRCRFPFQLHGSVADGVLRQAHCPVLCLRNPNAAAINASG